MSKEKTKTNTPIPQELVNLLEQIDNEWKQAERPVTKSQEIKRYDLEQGNDPLGDYRDYVEFEDNTAAVAKKDDEIAALCAQPKDKQSITVLLGKIKRYDMEDGDFDASGGVICAYLVESKFGEWVRYTDVVELLNHLKLLSEHIIQLPNGKYQLRSKKKNKQGKTKNLGTFNSRGAAEKHEQEVQYFKHANESVSPRRHECPAPLNLKQDRSGRHPCASAEFGKHCQCYHRGGICCQCDSKFKPAIKETKSLKKKVGTFKSRASDPFRKQYSLYGHTSYSNST